MDDLLLDVNPELHVIDKTEQRRGKGCRLVITSPPAAVIRSASSASASSMVPLNGIALMKWAPASAYSLQTQLGEPGQAVSLPSIIPAALPLRETLPW